MLSHQLIIAIKTSNIRQYQLAHLADVHPGTLSAWLNGIYRVRPGDARILKIAKVLGVPEDQAFAEQDGDASS